ncbi:hypothetical protein [Pseudomonas phage L15]|nr:hypothetical protein [Pseudomonas phage L15]
MTPYTAFEYLLIDAANQMGHDKWLFEQRIQWCYDNFDDLENLECNEKTRPQYLKAVMAIRAAQRGEPVGHLVGLDACCSGMQIMSALGGCESGAQATNLINTGFRQDAYSLVTTAASTHLGESVGEIKRSDIKTATMTHFYGSKAEPKNLFGEDTPELEAFYQGVEMVAPIANEMRDDLINTWQPYAMKHSWVLPDNFHSIVKSTDVFETRVEVDEMEGASFEYIYKQDCGVERAVKNAANVIHSIDAYVLRSMHRRCNYDREAISKVMELVWGELMDRHSGKCEAEVARDDKLAVYEDLYDRTNMVDAVIFNHINAVNVCQLETDHLEALCALWDTMRVHEPFELVTVHDEFKCHPNFCNEMRQHYINIFAELADSNVLDDIVHQITGSHVSYDRAIHNLSELIRESEYALS